MICKPASDSMHIEQQVVFVCNVAIECHGQVARLIAKCLHCHLQYKHVTLANSAAKAPRCCQVRLICLAACCVHMCNY